VDGPQRGHAVLGFGRPSARTPRRRRGAQFFIVPFIGSKHPGMPTPSFPFLLRKTEHPLKP